MDTHEAISAVVVAGGKSTRFGSDKASAVLAGRSLLDWVVSSVAPACESIVVVRASGQVLPSVSLKPAPRVVDDLYEAKGPLAGLVAGFQAVETPLAFAVSCDVPLVTATLVNELASLAVHHDIVIPHVGGFPQPLLAVYRPTTCLPAFQRAVEEDQLKITLAFQGLRVRPVREPEIRAFDPALDSFRNLNRTEDLGDIESRLAERVERQQG